MLILHFYESHFRTYYWIRLSTLRLLQHFGQTAFFVFLHQQQKMWSLIHLRMLVKAFTFNTKEKVWTKMSEAGKSCAYQKLNYWFIFKVSSHAGVQQLCPYPLVQTWIGLFGLQDFPYLCGWALIELVWNPLLKSTDQRVRRNPCLAKCRKQNLISQLAALTSLNGGWCLISICMRMYLALRL